MTGRPYNRVEPTIWRQQWSNDVLLLAFYLLTCEHRTTEGLYRLPLEYIAVDLGWPLAKVTKNFGVLVGDGFVEYDAKAQVVLLVKALERQRPNPNQAKAAVKKLGLLPATHLRARFYALAEGSSPVLAEAMRKAFGNTGESLREWLGDPPTPPPTPALVGGSPVVPVACAGVGDALGNGGGNGKDSLTQLAEDIVNSLQRGIDGLQTDDWCKPPTVPVVLEALRRFPVSEDTALAVAVETRSIAQSQNRAPNIAGLFAQKLDKASVGEVAA